MQNFWNVAASGVHSPPYEVHAPPTEILDPPLVTDGNAMRRVIPILLARDDTICHSIKYRIYSKWGTRCQDQIFRGCFFSKQSKDQSIIGAAHEYNLELWANRFRALNILRHFDHPGFQQGINNLWQYVVVNKCPVGGNIYFLSQKTGGCLYLRGCLNSNKYGNCTLRWGQFCTEIFVHLVMFFCITRSMITIMIT